MKSPWDLKLTKLKVTKYFALKYMRAWMWDVCDLKEAINSAYKIKRVGKEKFEVYVQRKGFKKIVTVYYLGENELICITGSEGGYKK